MTALSSFCGNIATGGVGGNAAFIQQYNSFIASMGQSPTMYNIYTPQQATAASGWGADAVAGTGFMAAMPQLAPSTGMIPVCGFPLVPTGTTLATGATTYTAGTWDAFVNAVFQAFVTAGYKTVYMRPGYEMNIAGYPWSVASAGDATNYNTCFQRFATLAHAFAGAKIYVIWNPNQGSNGLAWTTYYPGDAYVDLIGLDIYGQPVNSDDIDVTVNTLDFTVAAACAMAISHNKLFCTPESSGTNEAFPVNLAQSLLANITPANIAFVNIWDYNTPGVSNFAWSGTQTNSGATLPLCANAWKWFYTAVSQGNPTLAGTTATAQTTYNICTNYMQDNQGALQITEQRFRNAFSSYVNRSGDYMSGPLVADDGSPFLSLKMMQGNYGGFTMNFQLSISGTATFATDPDANVGRAIKVYDSGIAVLGGARFDSINETITFVPTGSATTGSTQTATNVTCGLYLENAAGISTCTIKLPLPVSTDIGRYFWVCSFGGVTTATFQTSAAGAITGAYTSLTAKVRHFFYWDGTIWWPAQ